MWSGTRGRLLPFLALWLVVFCGLLLTKPRPPQRALLDRPLALPLSADLTSHLRVYIVANDLPPLFRRGRTLASLRFRFRHEQIRECAELYILDRLVEGADRDEVFGLLRERGLATSGIVERQLVGDATAGQLWDHAGALNLALEESKRRGSAWMIVLDPTVFVTEPAWDRLVSATLDPTISTAFLPTARVLEEQTEALVTPTTTLTTPNRSPQFSHACEVPQFAVRPSSVPSNAFRPSPPGSFAHITDFLLARCAYLYRYAGQQLDGCVRVREVAIRLFGFPATEEMAVPTTSPQMRRMALVLGAELLAAKARATARLARGLSPSHDDLEAVGMVMRLESGHQLVGKAGSPPLQLHNTTLRDIVKLRIAAKLEDVHKGLSPPPSRVPRVMCGRVLGNDIPPLQMHGQTYTNLRYVLQHEARRQCEYVFVVNRVVHEEMAGKLVGLLEANGFKTGSDVLVREIDWSLPIDELDLKHIGDVNGARNIAWDEGIRRGVEWIDLADANQFGTRALWDDMVRKILDPHPYPMLLKVMVRITKLQDPSWLNADTDPQQVPRERFVDQQEAQVVLPANSPFRFDPHREYANENKLSLVAHACGWAYVRSNVDLGDASPCVVLEGATFRLFPFRFPYDVNDQPSDLGTRTSLRIQGTNMLIGAGRFLWSKRRGLTPSDSDKHLFHLWRREAVGVGWTEGEGLQVPANLTFVREP